MDGAVILAVELTSSSPGGLRPVVGVHQAYWMGLKLSELRVLCGVGMRF